MQPKVGASLLSVLDVFGRMLGRLPAIATRPDRRRWRHRHRNHVRAPGHGEGGSHHTVPQAPRRSGVRLGVLMIPAE